MSIKINILAILQLLLITADVHTVLPTTEPKIFVQTINLLADAPGLHWENGSMMYHNKPFSGVITERHEGEQIRARMEYFQGRKHGLERRWYANGQLYWERTFKNGRKNGTHKGWWPNGQLKFFYPFKNGNYNGELREWYDNGALAKLFRYDNGRETGKQQAWRKNGKLYVNYVMKNGKRYGMVKSRLCYSVKNGEGQFVAAND